MNEPVLSDEEFDALLASPMEPPRKWELRLDDILEIGRKLLDYNPETGSLVWKSGSHNNMAKGLIGKPAGYITKTGHRAISLADRMYQAGRVAYLLHYGRWPVGKIQYLDGDVLNIKISNMKEGFDLGVSYKDRPAYEKARRKAFPSQIKNSELKRAFGITVEQYEEIAKSQDFVCSICKQPEREKRNGRIRALAVDHNHTTGKIRGLLCGRCNKFIGQAEENVSILEAAIAYLNEHNENNVVPLNVNRA